MTRHTLRIEVDLSRRQHELLKEKAQETKRSMSEIVREAIDEYLGIDQDEGPFTTGDPLWDRVALAHCGAIDLSINHDSDLYGSQENETSRLEVRA